MKKRTILTALAAVILLALGITAAVVACGDYEELSGWQRQLYAVIHREELSNTDFIGTESTDIWSPEDEYKLEDHVILWKDPDKDFVVMNLTDLHMADWDYTYVNSVTSNRALYNIKQMAKDVGADLITISGDIFCEDGTANVESVHRLTEYMDSLQIPWAPIFDYHDEQGNCDLNYICDVMMESEYCLLRKGDPALGVGNYIINVCEERDGKTEVVHSILMMHSHHGNVWDNQIQWYKWALNGVNAVAGHDVTSSVILHVPFAQYQYAYDEAWDAENNCWRDGYEAFGYKGESVCGETDENGNLVDNGFFAAMQEIGTTTNTICGHDHENGYSVLYQGIRLTYSLRLGTCGYYDTSFETCNAGSTILTIGSDGTGTVTHHFLYPEFYENGLRISD